MPNASRPTDNGDVIRLDALVIGAGWGGMYALHRLRGMGLSVKGIEAGDGVGGTWYWNRYPGARCDVMSIDYCYSFSEEIQQEWTWSEQFAAQPEILAYANFVADKLDLRRDIGFETRATSVVFDDARQLWTISTDRGERFEVTYCIMATGPLSVPKGLDIPGADSFGGTILHAARWPHDHQDFTGKRVGVIGTGSTGIQIVPVVAAQAGHLYVFQRTPSFTMPMRNKALDADYIAQVKAHYPALRAYARTTATGGVRPQSTRPLFSVPADERLALMEDAWAKGGLNLFGLFSDVLYYDAANEIVADFVRGKIGEVVEDPETARKLTPVGYPIFARRPCIDTGYYEAFNRDNVTLVDCLIDPIQSIDATGVVTAAGHIDLDVIIVATGYDGLTGAMLAIDITGRDGVSLKDRWSAGSRAYLGLAMAGFPNLFMVAGANGPSALANFFILNEQNVDWTCGAIAHLRDHDFATIEATHEAEDAWMETVAGFASKSLMPRANTWYTGTNIAGKPRVFGIYMGGLGRYTETCNAAAADNYRGFVLA